MVEKCLEPHGIPDKIYFCEFPLNFVADIGCVGELVFKVLGADEAWIFVGGATGPGGSLEGEKEYNGN